MSQQRVDELAALSSISPNSAQFLSSLVQKAAMDAVRGLLFPSEGPVQGLQVAMQQAVQPVADGLLGLSMIAGTYLYAVPICLSIYYLICICIHTLSHTLKAGLNRTIAGKIARTQDGQSVQLARIAINQSDPRLGQSAANPLDLQPSDGPDREATQMKRWRARMGRTVHVSEPESVSFEHSEPNIFEDAEASYMMLHQSLSRLAIPATNGSVVLQLFLLYSYILVCLFSYKKSLPCNYTIVSFEAGNINKLMDYFIRETSIRSSEFQRAKASIEASSSQVLHRHMACI